MRNYILSIIATAIFYAITRSILEEKTTIGQIVRLLGSMLLSVAIIAPIKNISFQDITTYFDDISVAADSYIEHGTISAQESKRDIIKAQSEAYILDKAIRMGLDISVEVSLNEDNLVPNSVTITGTASPYAKEVMKTFVEDTLGIAKEDQCWN